MDAYLKEFGSWLKSEADKLRQELQGIRSGRPSPELLENVKVSYFDQMLSIKQLGSISVKPPREIDVTAWDHEAVPAIAKAVQDAKLGITPNVEGNVIRCFLPPLTQERREEFARIVKKMAEEARIRIRHERDETIKKIKAAEAEKKINEDDAFKGKTKVQKLVDGTNETIESFMEQKLAELSE